MTIHRLRLSVALVTIVAASVAAQQPRSVFRSGARTVMVHATVRGGDGRLVPDLPREAFTVLDNGRPADVTVFSSEPQPITVTLLIDMSGSMEKHFLRVRAATREFIKALHPEDRARIGTFGDEVALSPHLTGDKALLWRIVEEETWPGGGTPLWTAAHEGMTSLEKEEGRRVVLVLSDGVDATANPAYTAADVESRAIKQGFMLYAIGVEGTGLDSRVKDIADYTGGGFFDLKPTDDLASTFARVVEELRHQYVLGFTPAALDGKRHRVEVKLPSGGMKARARQYYVATPDGSIR